MNKKLPVVVGIEIPLDEFGRYNLNVLHKASSTGEDKSPGQWLRRKSTKGLIEELERNLLKENQNVNLHSAQKSIDVVNGGAAPGTFAHELLAVEYAGWISPAFRLQVNQAFIDFKSGKVGIDLLNMPSVDVMIGRFDELRHQLVRDEKEEAELLTLCSLMMNARKKTKPKRQRMIEVLEAAGQGSLELAGGGRG